MAKMQKVIVTLLILSILFSVASVVFSVVIYKMSSENDKVLIKESSTNNYGNVGFFVEEASQNNGEEYGE